jgi:hypothetical protein
MFCTKCIEKEAELEIIRKEHFEEIRNMQLKIDNLQNQVDALSLDVAFYGGSMINLSCNDK